jgi:ABC-2 type transport system permease protein
VNGAALLSLFRVQFLAGLNLNAFVLPRKRVKAWLAAVGLTACLTPSYLAIVALQVKAFSYLRSSGLRLEDLLLIGVYASALFMILFAGIPAVYAALYQSNELSILLPLPYHPWQIVAAKLGVIYAIELLVGWAFFLPALITYYAYGFAPPALLPVAVAGMLLMPAIPLALSAVACMLIANVPVLGRSKWFWYVGITAALVCASLLLTSGLMAADAGAMADLVEVRMRQVARLGRMLPGTQFAMNALVAKGLDAVLQQALHVCVALTYIVAALAVGGRLYVGPILRGGAIARRRPVGSPAASAARIEAIRPRSLLAACVHKEWVCVLKDPAVAMNGLGGYIALPLLAVTYTVMKVQSRGKVDIIGQLDRALHSEAFANHLPYGVVGIALGLAMFGGMTSLFAASYSKDGKRLWVEKSLPAPPFTVFLGKFLSGYGLVSALNLLTLALATLVVPFGPGHWLYVALLSQIMIAWNAAVGLAIDCARPKLVWKDTVQAVKQNMNVVLAMGVGVIGGGINIGLLRGLWVMSASPVAVYASILAANLLLLAAAAFIGRGAAERLHRIQV